MEKTIYISSTFRELKEHRAKVAEFFRNCSSKFEVVAMENYVAESIAPVEKCIEDVKACNIYVLILANRYGFVPAGSEKSVTETEYETAKQTRKKIFAFITDDPSFPADEGIDAEEKKEKLQKFKDAVRSAYLTHPDEQFISPDSLVVQLSETLMREMLKEQEGAGKKKEYFIPDLRKYCCDRKQQFGDYLLHKAAGHFKTFVIQGHRDELGRDLINRILLFTINDDSQRTLTFHCINDFLQSDYNKAKEKLIVNILADDLKMDRSNPLLKPDFSFLIEKINGRSQQDVVIVLSDDALSFDERAVNVLTQFLTEFHAAYKGKSLKDVYFFVNIQDEGEGKTDEIVKQLLAANEASETFVFELQRLEKGNAQIIEQWISCYLTGDEGRIRDLMDACFENLLQLRKFSMYEADKSIRRFMKKLNAKDSLVYEILNV